MVKAFDPGLEMGIIEFGVVGLNKEIKHGGEMGLSVGIVMQQSVRHVNNGISLGGAEFSGFPVFREFLKIFLIVFAYPFFEKFRQGFNKFN
jgi:hypothetical protein